MLSEVSRSPFFPFSGDFGDLQNFLFIWLSRVSKSTPIPRIKKGKKIDTFLRIIETGKSNILIISFIFDARRKATDNLLQIE